MKRLVCIALSMAICFGMLGYSVCAANNNEYELREDFVCPFRAESEGEDLFAGYVDQLFYGNRSQQGQVGTNSLGSDSAGSRLSGDDKILYDALVPVIKEIAAGQRESTYISIGRPVNGIAADIYAEFTGSYDDLDLNALISALMADMPYEMYWYDKTYGCRIMYYDESPLPQIIMGFTVADAWVGADYYSTDTAKTKAAAKSAANAALVVADNDGLGDYAKLCAYRDYICGEVEYNYAAVEDETTPYGDPWQLIYVFDGDESTDVVCEGYSKAFQYLCDMSTWNGNVSCYSVTGYMDGGGHMWNIVRIGGAHYMVDVTNSDSGSIGQNGGLFLAGSDDEIEGTLHYTNGSTVTLYGYRFYAGYYSSAIDYLYDPDLLWGDTVLTLAASDYEPAVEISSLSLDRNELSLQPGQEFQLVVSYTPADADAELQWSSSDENVLIVENGRITALAPGKASVTVSGGGLSATCEVDVDVILDCISEGSSKLKVLIPGDILSDCEMLIVVSYTSDKMTECVVISEPEWSNIIEISGSEFKVLFLRQGYRLMCECLYG